MSSPEPAAPRGIGHDRLIRFLSGHGWAVAREGQRHTILEKDDTQVAVPRRLVLKSTTLAAVLKFIGIPHEDWSKVWTCGHRLSASKLWTCGHRLDASKLWTCRHRLDASKVWTCRHRLDASKVWTSEHDRQDLVGVVLQMWTQPFHRARRHVPRFRRHRVQPGRGGGKR